MTLKDKYWVKAIALELQISKRMVIDIVMESYGVCYVCNTLTKCGKGVDRANDDDGLQLIKLCGNCPASMNNLVVVCTLCKCSAIIEQFS